MELGQRSLRTKQLTERIRGFSPRSVYRCVGKLEEYGLIDRHEETGVPSTVLLRLTAALGRPLFRLLRLFTSSFSAGVSTSEHHSFIWDELYLLGDLWEAGFVEAVGHEPRSLMELMEGPHHLTYHQARRRVSLSTEKGLLEALPHNGNGKDYDLADKGRRYMSLVAGLGRWRHRYAVADGTPGLTIEEMATVLRAALPLTVLPEHAEMRIDLIVAGALDPYGHRDTATVQGRIDSTGAVRPCRDVEQPADGSAAGTLNTWFAALLDDHRGRVRVRGELGLVDACLTQLYKELWEKERPVPAT
ncbi:MAG: hypothetical protein M3335_05690 [Actinomycetota bacterium]|nr:hypothetical protein [Actinomycetota bacterium]